MATGNSLSRLTRILILGIFLQFLVSGMAVFVNLFVPFLNEAVFAIVSLVLIGEIVIGVIVGKVMQALSSLRWLRESAAKLPAEGSADS